MAYTITLYTLDQIIPIPVQGQREKIKWLLPKDIRRRMFGENCDCSNAYANYTFNASFNDQNLGAKSAYKNCATLISECSADVSDYLEEISNKWNECIKSDEFIFEKRAKFRTALENDADYTKITKNFRTRLNNALIQRDKKLLLKVLSALTILAITRGVDGQWQSVSRILYDNFPDVSSLPGNPTKKEEKALSNYTQLLSDRDSQTTWSKAKEALEVVFENKNERWRANVYETLGTFWFEEFLWKWKRRSVFVVECTEHLEWFYTPSILSPALFEKYLDKEHLEELIRFTALNFFIKAQSCLEGLNDRDAQMQLGKISDSYLTQLIRLYLEGHTQYLEPFRQVAEQIAKQSQSLQKRKSWYGEACLKLAEACLKKKDEFNFTAYLKLSRKLKYDNEFAQYLALRVLSPLESDPYKEFFAKIRKNLLWKAHYLAMDLKESENLRICGEANWRLYVESGGKNRDFLHKAWRCGFPHEAVQEWDKEIVSYCETLEHATSCDEATCWINVDSSHFIARIFSSTCPETFDVSYKSAINESATRENFRSERLIALLVEDNAEKNLSDFLQLLECLRKNHSATSVTIFVRGSEDLLTPIIDTALQQYFNHNNDENFPIIRVEIVDEIRDAARQLLARHPAFFPIRKKKAYQEKTLRFIIVGDGQLAKELVREAAWLMMSLNTLNKNLNINPKITLLTPLGRSLINEIRAVNYELAEIIEEKNVLLPGFIAPDSNRVQTLTEVIEEFVNAGDSLYFACAISQYNLNNLSLAITIREILLRSWLKYSKEIKPFATPVAFYCPNEDLAFLSARTIVLGEEYGSTSNFANSYNLIPFGNRMRFSFHNLYQNIFSRIALAVHLNYCGIFSKEDFSEEDCLASYKSYSRKTYNRQSSLAVAMSLPYRIFAYEQLTGNTVFDENWDITNENEIFSEDNLQHLAEKFKELFNANEAKELFQWEHARWCKHLILSENWSPATLEDAKKFIVAGNLRQQLFAAKMHSCLSNSWGKLDEISKVISQLLRNNGLDLKADKNFKKSDEISVICTSEILDETVLRKSGLLKKLFLTD